MNLVTTLKDTENFSVWEGYKSDYKDLDYQLIQEKLKTEEMECSF